MRQEVGMKYKLIRSVEAMLLSIATVFAPIKSVIITAGILVIADLVLGIMAARHRKEPITSAGFRRSITKVFIYEIAIMLAYITETYLTGPDVPVSKIVSGFVGITELKSVIENLNELSGDSIFKLLVDKLSDKRRDE